MAYKVKIDLSSNTIYIKDDKPSVEPKKEEKQISNFVYIKEKYWIK